MPQIFHRSANTVSKASIGGALTVLFIAGYILVMRLRESHPAFGRA